MQLMPIAARLITFALAATPFVVAFSQQPGQDPDPTSDQVYSDIKVFKGVPSSDLIPAMEFMCASLKYECSDCHDPKDYAAPTRAKDTTRKMVIMQREINEKNFNGRNEVTCMTCHNGREKPTPVPTPAGVSLRHKRLATPVKAEDLIAKHVSQVGERPSVLIRTGTLTAPNDVTHKVESQPVEFIQTKDGKFRLMSINHKIGSDGETTWYGEYPMNGEPAYSFNRMGKLWIGNDPFVGLNRPTVVGSEDVGKASTVVLQGTRPATSSAEELYFDSKSGLIVRQMNARRSTIGTVVTAIDYSNYKTVSGVKVPMKIVTSFAGDNQWILDFKTAKIVDSVPANTFKIGGK